MSKKHWMIRTHDHHLLGPVSKDKIQALLLDKAFHPLDELCEGDGAWFYVRDGEILRHNFPFYDQANGDGQATTNNDRDEDTKEISLPQEILKEPKKRCYYPLFLLFVAAILCGCFFLLYLLSFLFYK